MTSLKNTCMLKRHIHTSTGDVRNDIYVTLEFGQFEKGNKRAERNVEVSINVMDGDGKVIPVSLMGSYVLC